MGRKSATSGISALRNDRIQFDFKFQGLRFRPTLLKPPTEANIRRACEKLIWIKRRIAAGTFCFEEEFPDFRFPGRISSGLSPRTCNQVFDAFLVHTAMRVRFGDLEDSTLQCYRKILDNTWRPAIGSLQLRSVRHSVLLDAVIHKRWKKKTYNNAISVLRRALEFGFKDYPESYNPAVALKCLRLRKNDRPKIDPFTIQDAETLIAALREDWGAAEGNYDEFRFFTGLRPSEQISLTLSDFDASKQLLRVNKARVLGISKYSTKTDEDRNVELCPRAIEILEEQLVIREKLILRGQIKHDRLFFDSNGAPIKALTAPYKRWRRTLKRLRTIRYRRPYTARHCSVSWNLMIGKTPLWVAKQHGHSLETMLRTYTAWAEDAIEADIERIEHAIAGRPRRPIAKQLTPTSSAPINLQP